MTKQQALEKEISNTIMAALKAKWPPPQGKEFTDALAMVAGYMLLGKVLADFSGEALEQYKKLLKDIAESN